MWHTARLNPPPPEHKTDSARCPICEERADRRILNNSGLLEESVARRLRDAHPEWRREHGACIRCVSWALADLTEKERKGKLESRGAVPEGIGRRREVLSLQSRLLPDLHYLGRGVTVAIVDSDFVYHPDFIRPKNRIISYVDASGVRPIEDATPPPPYLGSWHGTMVAGAGFGSGWLADWRYPGIAPKANLVFVRIADATVKIGEPQVLRGLRFVLNHHQKYSIRIVNMSVGGDVAAPSAKNALDRLVARAVKAGIVIITAAGNRPGAKPVAPASSPDAITVGGINDLGTGETLQIFPGAHGPTLDGLQKPDLLAPAIWVPAPMVPGTAQAREAELLIELESLPDDLLIRTIARRFSELTLPEDIIRKEPAEARRMISERRQHQKFITAFHQHVDGTSFATAIVSAVAAQMLEANPALSPADVKKILTNTAKPLPGVPYEIQGAGVVNAALAVRAALEQREGAIPQFGSPVVAGDRVYYQYFDPADRQTSVDWLGALGSWKPAPMRKVTKGLWVYDRPLPTPGRYLYKFLLSDGRWTHDPINDKHEPDGFGGWNSVLVVRKS